MLCVIDIFSKYAWVIPLNNKKDTAINNAFEKIINKSNRREAKSKGRKPNRIWVDKVHIRTLVKKLMIKILNLQLMILVKYQHIKTIWQKSVFQIGLKMYVFVIKIVKNTVPWAYVTSDLKGEEIVETFYEKELQKTNQKEFRVEKLIKRKGDKLYLKWKGYGSSFYSSIDKKDIV